MYFLTYCLVAGFVGGLLVLAALLRALELSGKLPRFPFEMPKALLEHGPPPKGAPRLPPRGAHAAISAGH
ncbi:MAG: hypothetical protein U0230_16960 [Polyangiales bacterium]